MNESTPPNGFKKDSAARDRRNVAIGGLMRCCLQTRAHYEGEESEGTALPCKWCSSSMIAKNGVWRWNHD